MVEVILFMATVSSVAREQAPSAEKILGLALKQRQGITTMAGTFDFRIEEPKEKIAVRNWKFRSFLDGNKLRQDLGGEIISQTQCLNCEKEGQYIYYHPMTIGDRGRVSIEFGTMPGVNRKADANYGGEFLNDPRVIGLQVTHVGALHRYKLDTILGSAEREGVSLEKTQWNGYEAFVVHFSLKQRPKSKLSYWVVPSMDHSVVRVDGEFENLGKKTKVSMKCEMARFGKKEIWFPKSYVTESVTDGVLIWRETLAVSNLTINEPIAPETFTFAGLNIPADWPIQGTALPDKTKRYKWDGNKIVEREEAPKKKAQPKQDSSSLPGGGSRGALLIGAGGLAVAGTGALGFYGFYYRRRREISPTTTL